ncbi:RagB/SusD family nutrient uptake outer membrane protein [Sphingobacterium olei]|uniref:RagB/SusD family nutrient uptake outer membrane protein n=1 Tax=Sphingobacterium olei TaxID=2571155 RepID=A0A4U0P4L6_9SPHI|nr:RagB/SusD family nutrient uptake outer membrane protein [Sphingobacterium olei]TJZ62273.1 RagB/SusD family nutrient uptake outer membrane protein [Sphingobacterium olei]
MKKRYIKSFSVLTAMLLLFAGCEKFLEQDVPGQYSEDDFYESDVDATQAVTAIYNFMAAHYNGTWGSVYFIKTLPSDEANAGGSGPGDQPGYQQINTYNFDATNESIRDVWRMCYYTIFRANKVINKVSPDNDLRKRLIAEAKVIRAYQYFELTSLWGDVPLVLDDVPATQYTSTGRQPRADVYAQVEQDCRDAIAVLPIRSGYAGGDRFRVTKGTAQALLGKVLLYQEKWQSAAAEFDNVITSNQYGLEPSIGHAFSRTGEFGKESIFEVSYASDRSYDWGNFPWDSRPISNIHIQLMGPRSDFYVKAPADSLVGGWGFITPKKKLWDAFIAAGDVDRRKNTVMSLSELRAAGGDWTSTNAYQFEGYFQRKYGTYASQSGAPVAELNYGNNWRLIRYSDVLLMAAEAYYRSNDEDRARTELNKVRLRANLPDITATGTALFESIVSERQLELAYEGARFPDLVRWGRASAELAAQGFIAGKHELMPIPDNEVRTGGLTQNNY